MSRLRADRLESRGRGSEFGTHGSGADLPSWIYGRCDLKKEEQPYSSDPEFWNVWTNPKERSIDWKTIANDWQLKKSIEKDKA